MRKTPIAICAILSAIFFSTSSPADSSYTYQCTPRVIHREPDPIIRVDLAFSNNPKNPDAWDVIHHSRNGISYVRSEQYDFSTVGMIGGHHFWDGELKTNFKIGMMGIFTRNDGIYMEIMTTKRIGGFASVEIISIADCIVE
jgi:hypothetical protein